MFADLREDVRCCAPTRGRRLQEILFNPGMWAVIGYRLRRAIYMARIPRPLKIFLNLFSAALETWIEMTSNIHIPHSVSIGPGLCIPHIGYIVVGSRTAVGSHCTLTQGVTIGHAGGGAKDKHQHPVIGDRVYIGPGAAIIGPVTVGDDALIGVGAVVTQSVPARAVMMGNPARVISFQGSFELIVYPNMEKDAARIAARANLDP
jgi:serine O-acetyltransferase